MTVTDPKVAINRARRLRKAMTPAESLLWQRLRGRESGFKFRRQHPFGPYVVDFFCEAAGLVVEVDGGGHFTEAQRSHDEERTHYLEGAGFHVLRVTNVEVLTQLDSVLDEIWDATRGYNPSP